MMLDLLDSEDMPYICPKCGSHWSSLRLLREHLELEHSLQPSLKSSGSSVSGVTKMKHSNVRMTEEAMELQRRLRLGKDAENRQKHALLGQSSRVTALKAEMQQLAEAVKEQQEHSNRALQQQRHLLERERKEQQNLLAASLSNTRQQIENIRSSANKVTEDQQNTMGHLEQQLQERDSQIKEARTQLDTTTQERLDLLLEVKELRRRHSDNDKHVEHLQTRIEQKEAEIENKQSEMGALAGQVQEATVQQVEARDQLQDYIQKLLERAEVAEAQVRTLNRNNSLTKLSEQASIDGVLNGSVNPAPDLARSLPADVLSDYLHPHNIPSSQPQHWPGAGCHSAGLHPAAGSDHSEEMIIPVQTDHRSNLYSARAPAYPMNSLYQSPTHNHHGNHLHDPPREWPDVPIDDHGIIWDGASPAGHYPSHLYSSPSLRQNSLERIFLPSAMSPYDSEADTGYGTNSLRWGREASVAMSDVDRESLPPSGREKSLFKKMYQNSTLDLKCEKWRLREKMQLLRAKERVLKTSSSTDSTSDSLSSITDGSLTSVTNGSLTSVTRDSLSSYTDSSDSELTVVTAHTQSSADLRGYTPHPPLSPRPRSISPRRTLISPDVSHEKQRQIVSPLPDVAAGKNRQEVLFCIFMYLDLQTRLQVALVCNEWKTVSRHPALWRSVVLSNRCISSKFLHTLSQWCTQVTSLSLQGLTARPKRYEEGPDTYSRETRGCLEAGIEQFLKACCNTLVSLKVINCANILTDRCLWLASCYCRCLQRVAYISNSHPVGSEVIWALGAGCRDISTLIVPPLMPNVQPEKFSNKCVQMIGRCWPELRVLCIGGPHIDLRGLAAIARLCRDLQVLEMDHMEAVDEANAVSMCRAGLDYLHTLDFTFTPVSAAALKQFARACRRLKCIKVHQSLNDYLRISQPTYTRAAFDNMATELQELCTDPQLMKVLMLRVDYS